MSSLLHRYPFINAKRNGDDPVCGSCLFFVPPTGSNLDALGNCRASVPPTRTAGWGQVRRTEWCGEWYPTDGTTP